jgi:hypothetical protein
VWQFGEKEENSLDSGLPSDGGVRRKPWLLHSMDVKEMTFCGMDVIQRKEVHKHGFSLISGRINCRFLWWSWRIG